MMFNMNVGHAAPRQYFVNEMGCGSLGMPKMMKASAAPKMMMMK